MLQCLRCSLPALLVIAPLTYANSPPSEPNEITRTVNSDIVEAGDMLQILLPAAGLFAAWMYDDAEGAKQLVYATASTQAIVQGMKYTVGRKRPNDSNWHSFPSGHTSAAFSGAAFLQSRYGAAWGIPAYAGATFVGLSRIHGNRHYAGDVVAGAGIAFLVNQYFVSPYRTEGVYFSAQPTQDGIAVGVTLTDAAFEDKSRDRASYQLSSIDYKNRIELGIGVNLADSSGQFGATEFLSNSELIDEYQPFSYINYQRKLANNNSFEFEFIPSETRRRGNASQPFTVDGVTYEPGDGQLFTAFRHWTLGSSAYKGYKINEKFDVNFGLGLYVHWISVDVDKNEGGKYSTADSWRVLPNLAVKTQYKFTDEISVLAKAQYQFWEGDAYAVAEAGLQYQINPAWDAGLKYSYTNTELDNSTFKANYDSQSIVLTFANRF
ncbi:phosphatase PAP2 family protein [Photobacterium sanguinicancri]|uniref:phosphatase PAP2 family protein n=1 Tax=Photobacterium sanguinicancri TaxID=875932 RepID=UPI0021C4ACC6|nr:phosphatase PAP2 family protein [Photobacterium sanguinicancri]